MKEETFDVVIVGGGGSGLAAAIAASASARTVVLEKGATLRGTTGISVGSITASRTRRQKAQGVEDDPAAHLRDYLAMAGSRADRDNPALSRLLVENVGETVDWLEDLGVVFFGPVQEPPHQKPRMHNVLPSSRSYIHCLARDAGRRGVTIRLSTAAYRLVLEDGRVAAVIAEGPDGRSIRYNALRGIVLAGGDFSNDPRFRATYLGTGSVGYEAANHLATGDCQRMAMELGASICNADLFEGPQMRFPPPAHESWLLRLPPIRPLGVLMRWGLERLPGWLVRPFALEFVTTYLAPDPRFLDSGAVVVDQGGNPVDARHALSPFYIVMDAELFDRFCRYPDYIATAPNVAFAYADDFRRNRPDIFFSAPDLPALAQKIGVPEDRLLDAMSQQGRGEAAPSDPARGTGRPPYHAMGPVMPYVLTTHGGLRVSERLEVLGRDDLPIAGLYAAGSAGRGGVLLPGHGHSLGWAFTSGRLAGAHAAAT